MDATQVEAYLARIGAARPARADLEALRELQRLHLLAVPFENLSIHLGEPVVLEEEALLEKVVGRRRGGFCYELNGAFSVLLRELGFPVTRLSARVLGEGGKTGPPFDHMTLRVDLDDPWLVDVGFGALSTYPLRLQTDRRQDDPSGHFALVDAGSGDTDALMNEVPQYRFEARPRDLADYRATCWWHQTSPHSHFTQNLVCSRMTGDGRVTLSGRNLVVTARDGRQESALDSDEAVLGAYRDLFGIVLDRVPTLRPLLAR